MIFFQALPTAHIQCTEQYVRRVIKEDKVMMEFFRESFCASKLDRTPSNLPLALLQSLTMGCTLLRKCGFSIIRSYSDATI
jgi:hypothetical protein